MPVILLHLHLARRRRVEVTSLELWRGLAPEGARRGGIRDLRDGLALAFVLAALAAFTLSAMEPVTGRGASEPRRLAVVLDASRTMTVRMPGGRTRFDAARDAARAAILRAAPHDDVVVWLAGEDPVVVVEPTHDAAAAAAALDALSPSLAPSGVALAVRLAIRAAPGASNRPATVAVFTDAVGATALGAPPAGPVRVVVGAVDASRDAANAGITEFDLDPADPSRATIRVATTDGAPRPRTLRCGRASVPVEFDADGTAVVSVPIGAASGVLEARLDPPDDFAEDDAARLAFTAPRALAVAVVADTPSPFLVRALRAMPDVVDPARTVLVRRDAPASATDGADVVVVDDGDVVAGRPCVAFGAGGRRVDAPILWSVGAHPVLAGADLAPLRIGRSAVLAPAPGDVPIVGSAAGPVGVAGESSGARRVAFGFRCDASTLPLESAFPILVRNALLWTSRAAPGPRWLAAGEVVPGGGGAVAELPPPGGPYDLRLADGRVTVVRVPVADVRIAPRGASAGSASAAVEEVALRRDDRDTRRRHGRALAALGAALLAVGALFLTKGGLAVSPRAPAASLSR